MNYIFSQVGRETGEEILEMLRMESDYEDGG